MLVSGFMVPAEKVVKCSELDSINKVIDLIFENRISAVVVADKGGKPIGLVTKTELVQAYRAGTQISSQVGTVMKRELTKVQQTADRDGAAKALENAHEHHAIVVDSSDNFVGLISSWDITAECAKDSRAWPWTRTADGHVHPIH